MLAELNAAGIAVNHDPLKCLYIPDVAVLNQADAPGKEFAKSLHQG